jgi:Domain of unknown function (DU1801)
MTARRTGRSARTWMRSRREDEKMPGKKLDGEAAVLEVIAGMQDMQPTATRLHEVILASAPELKPRLWYGMPGYAKAKSSPVLCFFRVDDGLMTFGVTEKSNLTPEPDAPDQLIGSAWFLTGLDAATEARITAIVEKAVG